MLRIKYTLSTHCDHDMGLNIIIRMTNFWTKHNFELEPDADEIWWIYCDGVFDLLERSGQ